MKKLSFAFILFVLLFSLSCLSQKDKEIFVPTGHIGSIEKITVNRKKNEFASIDNDKIILWNLQNGQMIRTIFLDTTMWINNSFYISEFSNDIIVSSNEKIQIYNSETGKLELSFIDREDKFNQAYFNQDESLIITIPEGAKIFTDDSTLNYYKIWHSKDGSLVKTYKSPNRLIKSARFSLDGKMVICLEYDFQKYDDFVVIYDWKTDKELIKIPAKAGVEDAFFTSKDNEFCIVYNQIIDVYNSKSGSYLRSFKHPNSNNSIVNQHISAFTQTPDETKIAISFGWDKLIAEYDFKSGKLLRITNFDEPVNNLTYIDNNTILKNFIGSNSIYLWDINKKTIIKEFESEINTINYFELSSDGEKFVQCNKDGSLEYWSVKNAEQIYTYTIPNAKIKHAVFNKSATEILLTVDNGLIVVFDIESRKESVKLLLDSSILNANYIANEKSILVCSKTDFKIYNFNSSSTEKSNDKLLKLEHTFSPNEYNMIKYIEISPSKETIVLDIYDPYSLEFIKKIIWDLTRNEEINIDTKELPNGDVVFSNDSRFLSINNCCTPLIVDLKEKKMVNFKDQWKSDNSFFESYGGNFSSDNSMYAITGDNLALSNFQDSTKYVQLIDWNKLNASYYRSKTEFVYFFRQNSKLIISNFNKQVVYDLNNQKIIHEVIYKEFGNYDILITPDEKYAICIGNKKNVFLWNLVTGEIEYSRYSFKGNKWFMIDRNNNLKGQKEALEILKKYN